MQRNNAGRPQRRLSEPAQAEERQQNSNRELQQVNWDAVEKRSQQQDDSCQQREAGSRSQRRRRPTAQRRGGEYDGEGLDRLDDRREERGGYRRGYSRPRPHRISFFGS